MFSTHAVVDVRSAWARWSRLLPAGALCLIAACGGGAESPADGAEPDAGTADTTDAAGSPEPDARAGDPADAAPDAGPLPDALAPDLGRPYPPPDGAPPNRGPGLPRVTFTPEQLGVNCAYLDGGPTDISDHHNLVVMYDGYLLMPWAPEFGRTGGITLWDVSDPCAPVVAGSGTSDVMRESHSIGFSNLNGRWAVTNHSRQLRFGGILFWDLADTLNPVPVTPLPFDEYFYPDAYARVVLSVFWQVPYVYVAGADNGIYIVDATDPRAPVLVNRYVPDPIMRIGQVQVSGNLLVATAAEGARTLLLDVSDPARPQPVPGGDFRATDASGEPKEAYFTTFANGFVYYARKQGGGGLMIWDVRDPTRPVYAGDVFLPGNGGYVFVHEDTAYVGESDVARTYDISDPTRPTPIAEYHLTGDLDTFVPVGHLAVLSVDDMAVPDQGSAIVPVRAEPDARAPAVTWVWPPDGTTGLALSSRIGLGFGEMVDPGSVFEGSVRVYEAGTDPALTRVDGHLSAQETLVNFWPVSPLRAGTTYVVDVPAGGVADWAGNRTATAFTSTFTTVLAAP